MTVVLLLACVIVADATWQQVALDPTTYLPAGLTYDGARRDWVSSQPLFALGYLEANPRFTRSGRPHDLPVSYAEGHRRVLVDATWRVPISAAHNVAVRLVERRLMGRWSRRAIRVVGWIERAAMAAWLSYRFAWPHYRQAARNRELLHRIDHPCRH